MPALGKYVISSAVLLLFLSEAMAEGGLGAGAPAVVPGAIPLQSSASTSSSETGIGSTSAWITETISIKGPGFTYTGTVGAGGQGSITTSYRQATSTAGGFESATSAGPLSVTNIDSGLAFYKGGNGITKNETVQYVTIMVNGQPVTVAEEVALALSRQTQFGTAVAGYVGGNVNLPNGAYTATVVTSAKPSR